jgi:hypothetical protein
METKWSSSSSAFPCANKDKDLDKVYQNKGNPYPINLNSCRAVESGERNERMTQTRGRMSKWFRVCSGKDKFIAFKTIENISI